MAPSTDLHDVKMSDGCNIKAKLLNPDDTSKPVLLACHTLLSAIEACLSLSEKDEGAPGLSNHGETEITMQPFTDIFRVLVFDLRGCGDSDQQEPYTHERWCEDMDTLRRWTGEDKVTFIGGSHGGFLGLDYAVKYGQHLSALLVGSTAAQFIHGCMLEAFSHALTDPRSKDKVDPDQLIRIFCGTTTSFEDHMSAFESVSPLYAVPDHLKGEAEMDVGETMGSFVKMIPETGRAAHGYCLSRYDVRDQLKDLKMPVFVWAGRYDWILPPKYCELIADGLTNSKYTKYVCYEKSGHLPALEEKTKFQKDVREFLKEAKIPGLKV